METVTLGKGLTAQAGHCVNLNYHHEMRGRGRGGGGYTKTACSAMADETGRLRRSGGSLYTVRGITFRLCDTSVPGTQTMSLSSAFRAVGNDPGIITWRIEVS